VGIDLGTTYSCVAVWLEKKKIELRLSTTMNEGKKITPFVAFTDHQRLIGDAAKDQAAINPAENSVFGIFLSFCSSHVLSCSVCIVLD
jgi:L1 cell adhesion molecule like protein